MAAIGTFTKTNAELQDALRDRLDPSAIVLDSTDDGGFGLVRWVRSLPQGPEYIVHRWADKDKSDQPIQIAPGVLGTKFYGGFYTLVDDEAKADFADRS